MSSRILGMVPHAVIDGVKPLDDWKPAADAAMKNPQVTAAVPFTQMDGMLSYKGAMQPIEINGVDPALESKVSIVTQHIVQGRLQDLKAGEFGVVIGEITARRFRLNVGDKLTLIVPEISNAPGGITPRLQRLTVVGVFKVGAELDGSMALVNVADAAVIQRWQPNQVQGVRLALTDLYAAPQVSTAIAGGLGADYKADDWTHTQGSLFSAMKMEKTMIGLLLLMIVAVAAFNIIATLIMVVNDKGADIAILRTIGATPRQIMTIFMVQGTVIGVVGTIIGGVLGVIAAINVSQLVGWVERVTGQHIFTSDVYFISNLPSHLEGSDVALICSAGFILSFLATIYPAYRAAQIQPAHALRYE
jgi:lipoprotein-releasing system permease protein